MSSQEVAFKAVSNALQVQEREEWTQEAGTGFWVRERKNYPMILGSYFEIIPF